MDEDDDPAATVDDSLLRAVAAAPPIPVPRDLATFVLLEPGTIVDDDFRIEARLGAGGMGVVYAARDLKLDREVALKLMRLDRGPAQLGARLPDVFEREARATARLNHPNIVTLHQFGNWNGLLYLVLERLRGETLNTRLERGGVQLADGLRIMEQVARALVHTHAAGITHRDLKPQNVFLLADGGVKVLDFGVSGLGRMHDAPPPGGARPTRARSTLSLAGTPGYMAPEQWDGAPSGPHTDVFAAGVMLYQLVTGTLPYGTTPVDLAARPPSLDGKVPPAAADLVAVVTSCLEPRTVARLADASVLVARLQAIRAALGDADGPAVASPRGALATARVRSPSRRRAAVVVAMATVAVGAAAGLLAPGGTVTDRCTHAGQLAGVWDAAARDRVAARLQHGATWDAIARLVDTYTGQWVPLRDAACRVDDARAATCLDDRFAALTRYLDAIGAAKPEIDLASARSLPALADCSDPSYLARQTERDPPAVRDPAAAVPYALLVTGRGKDVVHAAAFLDGDIVISGYASAEATIAGIRVEPPPGAEDLVGFAARIGRDGRARWVTVAHEVSPLAIATAGDAVVIAGNFARNASIAGEMLAPPRVNQDGLVAGLDGATGALRWSVPIGGGSEATAVRALRSDADGNLYGAGDFAGEATFGGARPVSAGDAERAPFVASWTSAGALRWVQAGRGTTASKTWAVAVGEAVVVAAWVKGPATFGGRTIGDVGSCVVARLARDTGAVAWVYQERGRTKRCIADAVAVRGERVAVSGRHYFDTPGGWVAELALADGALRWVRPLGTAEHDTPKALAFAPDGTLTAAGRFTTPAMTSGRVLISNGDWDGYVATFDPAGTPLGAFSFGGATSDLVRWIEYGPGGELLVGGRFGGTMRIADRTLGGVAGLDGYLVELSPALLTADPAPRAPSASP
jgi:outer membrane protein assembly factor BamB